MPCVSSDSHPVSPLVFLCSCVAEGARGGRVSLLGGEPWAGPGLRVDRHGTCQRTRRPQGNSITHTYTHYIYMAFGWPWRVGSLPVGPWVWLVGGGSVTCLEPFPPCCPLCPMPRYLCCALTLCRVVLLLWWWCVVGQGAGGAGGGEPRGGGRRTEHGTHNTTHSLTSYRGAQHNRGRGGWPCWCVECNQGSGCRSHTVIKGLA